MNWTAAKLKSEISALGVNLSSRAIPKSALVQIYEQLSSVNNRQSFSAQHSDQNNSSDYNNIVETAISGDNNNTSGIRDNAMISSPGTSQSTINVTPDMSGCQPLVSEQDSTSHHHTATQDSGLLQSTVGMVSAMQGTIASLQATINSLLQKQTSESNSSNLERFYSGTDATQITNVVKQHGIAADNLPHIDVVSDSMRKNITSGKYINLAALLIPDNDGLKSAENNAALDFLKHHQRDHRLDRPLSITQFYKAFGIYKRVMCEAFPQRRDELDLYEADVGNIYEHYGEVFYQYHVQFSKQAAAYIEKGIKVDWSKRHKDMFQLLIGGSKTKLCDHCSQSDHQSPFCPTQINVAHTSKQRPNAGLESSKDRQGRQRITFRGKEICNNFNEEKGCAKQICPFEHICKRCKRPGHGQIKCRPNSSSGSEQSNSTELRNKQKSLE
ncbi:MAG: hypothetical protein KUF82_21295 [Candidatus Thiodiazotropha sp. (ex Ctena orbiculata)]|nr:hypothetical protein [Candidatus Thiodiazotropha taylori]